MKPPELKPAGPEGCSSQDWFGCPLPVFDTLVRARLPLPARLWQVEVANRRAMARYVTPASPCRITLFCRVDADREPYRPRIWDQLALGGVDVRSVMAVETVNCTHNEFVREPHVQALAAEFNKCLIEIVESCETSGGNQRAEVDLEAIPLTSLGGAEFESRSLEVEPSSN
jgi:hypothetical protein